MNDTTEHDQMTTVITTSMLAAIAGVPDDEAGEYETTVEWYSFFRRAAERRVDHGGAALLHMFLESPEEVTLGLQEAGRMLGDLYVRGTLQAVEE